MKTRKSVQSDHLCSFVCLLDRQYITEVNGENTLQNVLLQLHAFSVCIVICMISKFLP